MSTPTNPGTPGKGPGKPPPPPHLVWQKRGQAVQQASGIGATGKPSTTRSVVGGAGAGAATGAAVGSAFGGVGAAPGAVIGAGLGAVGGGIKAKGAKKALRAAKLAQLGPGRPALVGEFLVCMIIWALSPLTDKHQSDGAQEFLKRGAAICALFFILGLVSSTGRGPTKIAAGLGALVTLSLLVSDRDVFTALAAKVGGNSGSFAGTDGDNPDAGDEPNAAATPVGPAIANIGAAAARNIPGGN